jgi:hypothetical protein
LEPFGFLGAGERAVLTLAMANPGAVAIIDELPGRRVAAGLGVKVTGTLNVVLVAKQLGHVWAWGPSQEGNPEPAQNCPAQNCKVKAFSG